MQAADGEQLYSSSTIREVHGTVVVSQFPTWEDLLVLNDFGVWESFVLRSESSHVAGNLNRHGGGCATTPPCLFLGCSYVVNRVGLAPGTTLPFTVTSLTFGLWYDFDDMAGSVGCICPGGSRCWYDRLPQLLRPDRRLMTTCL